MDQVDELLGGMSRIIKAMVAKRLDRIAELVCKRAIEYRLKLSQEHLGFNFTGNLINSIFVGVYYGMQWQPSCSYYAMDILNYGPTRGKMTAEKDGSPRGYKFDMFQAWDAREAAYEATKKTDEKAVTKASIEQFARAYKPKTTDGYTIVLAYPVEYSRWVEKARQSTGMAFVEDEFTSKRREIAKWFVSEAPISDTRSGLWREDLDAAWAEELAVTANMNPNDVYEQMQAAGEHYYVGRVTLAPYFSDIIKEGESL